MKKSFILLLLSLLSYLLVPAQQTGHRIGLKVSPLSPGDSLLIALSYPGDEPYIMIVKAGTGIQYFPGLYKTGDTLLLNQWMWSTKECNFNGQAMVRIIMGDSDRIVNCNCGQASAGYKVGVIPPGIDAISYRIQFNFQGRPIFSTGFPQPGIPQYCPRLFNSGDTVEFVQLAGPRLCEVKKLIVGNSDTAIDLNCVSISRRVGIQLPYVDPKITMRYKFSCIYPNRSPQEIQISNANTVYYFPFRFAKGDTASIFQLEGPTALSLRPWPPVIQDTDLILTADVESPLVKTRIAGTYTAPPGTKITVQHNGSNDITLTAPAYNSIGNNSIGFSFPQTYDDGTAFSVSIKSQPPNCKCAIQPAANGVTPVDSLQLNIICSADVELVSRSTDNKVFNTFYETANPVVGGKGVDEGRYVAFVSYGTGLDGASGKFRQIFLRDMRTGNTKLISRAADGSEGNGNSFAPSISADGRAVAFESYATNLSAEDNNNGVRDVYVWKEGSGVSLVSKGTGGSGNSESYEPSISGDGSVIAFSSGASNLAPNVEGNSTVNVYLADRSGQIQLITKDIKSQKGAGGSAPSISEDGNKVVFCSYAYTLVQNDNNNLWDIFLWQRGMPVLKKISVTSSGGDRDQGTESASRVVAASISGNGNYIVYSTTATNMVNGDNNKLQDIFICNIAGGGVRRLSVTSGNTEGDGDSPVDQGGRIGISYDGNWICYNTSATNLGVAKGNIILQNTRTGKIIPVTNSVYNTTGRPMVSRYGASVVAGCSEKFDKRFVSSGIFSFFTGPLTQ